MPIVSESYMIQRKDRDDLCDEILGAKASRQHTFDFLLGDGIPGRHLPVDAFLSRTQSCCRV